MRKLSMVVVAIAALAVPAASRAGFDLGVRIGYAWAGGDLGEPDSTSGIVKMSDFVSGQLPFQLDLGWRIVPSLTVGGYLSYGFAQPSGSWKTTFCDAAGVSCTNWTFRAGAQVLWNILPKSQFDPWVGLGTGYEMLTARAEDATDHIQYQVSGWEFLNVQAGLDFHLGRVFALAPFVMYSFGQYSDWDISSSLAPTQSAQMFSKKTHSWFQVGIRGNFDWGSH